MTDGFYRLNVEIIQRSKGMSAVERSAYISSDQFYREYDGAFTKNYRREKHKVHHVEMRLPRGAAKWMHDKERFWNAVEKVERRKKAQLARSFLVSIPAELTASQGMETVRRFVDQEFVRHGLGAEVGFHDMHTHNPHAHVLVTMRAVEGNGFARCKLRAMDKWAALKDGWRPAWAHQCNVALEQARSPVRVSHLSHTAQGRDKQPLHESRAEYAQRQREIRANEQALRESQDHLIALKAERKRHQHTRAVEQEVAQQQANRQAMERWQQEHRERGPQR